jgi:hypothetical protein
MNSSPFTFLTPEFFPNCDQGLIIYPVSDTLHPDRKSSPKPTIAAATTTMGSRPLLL